MSDDFKVDIIGTGTSGNAVMIDDNILIDMGLPYKKIGSYLEKVDRIFITHRHGDHLNIPALRKLDKLKPWKLKNALYCNQDVADKIQQSHNTKFDFIVPEEHIINDNSFITYEKDGCTYEIETFKCVHDVENQGFVITKNYKTSLIFATDTSTIEYAPDYLKYDYIILEGNYDEDKLNDAIENGDDKDAYRAMRNLRHLSIQDFEDFVKRTRKENSFVYQLHESETFGLKSDVQYSRGGNVHNV